MKPMTARVRRILLACVVLVPVLGGVALCRRHFPHGPLRAGKITTFMSDMRCYAMAHDGWFPKGEDAPLASLQKLCPDWKHADALAGLSGNERRTCATIREGGTLTPEVSSWVYWPGFRLDDNPRIAVIWEREAGLFLTGTRGDGHAVGFADGGYKQIPQHAWDAFLREQEILRTEALTRRDGSGALGSGGIERR